MTGLQDVHLEGAWPERREAARFATTHYLVPGALLRPGCELGRPPNCLQDVMSANPIACKSSDKATAAAHAMIDVRHFFVSSPFGACWASVLEQKSKVLAWRFVLTAADPVFLLLSRRQPP